MADAEAVVNTKLVAYEGEDDSVSVLEREHEAPEVPEEGTAEVSVEVAEVQDVPDNKRKLEDMELLNNDESPTKKQKICGSEPSAEGPTPTTDQVLAASKVASPEIGTQETDGPGHPTTEKPAASLADGIMLDSAQSMPAIDGNLEQQPHEDKDPDGIGLVHIKVAEQSLGSGQIPFSEDIQHASANDTQDLSSAYSQDGHPYDVPSTAHRIDVPNDRVGVLIGKYGETIKNLQMNSGAKIQITRDTEVDPYSSTRIVELIGTAESVNKAEQLIKNVIAEADAGGSPALVARGFGALQSGDEQAEVQVPNEKVGVIIGKGGETIKNIQTKSGARIQLIPQHLPKGDASKERTVRITGSSKQVEIAKEMIKDILNQIHTRHSNTFRPPRGPGPVTHWGPRSAAPPQQTTGYNHQQRGMYPPSQYYSQPYGGYSQQPPPRGTYGSSWVQQRPAAVPMQASPQPGGYDYYNQAAPVHNNQLPNPVPGSGPGSAPAPTNYNYYQSQPPDAYGHSAPYTQPPTTQQKYLHGYSNEPKYDTQPPGQQTYAQQQPMGSQPGMYGPQSATPYGQPAYGAPQDVSRVAQPTDQMYQGAPQNQYPSSTPPVQQQHPYASNAPVQQAPPYNQQAYGPNPVPADGYSQQPAAGYAQPAPGYAQGGQAAPVYGQPVPQSGGYSQYSSSQPSYGDQIAQSNVNYGYPGAAPDAAYGGSVPNSGYASQQSVASQPGYSQTPTNPPGYYDQSMPPQSGYAAPIAAAPVAPAPVAYAKSVSPQPGYGGGQYDSGQTYAHL